MSETRSTCCYCGVGCGVLIRSAAGRIVDVRGDPDHPANFGRLCTKGATLHLSARNDTRALHPELRRTRSAPRVRAAWEDTLDFAAARFAATIAAHGPDSVAFYISGQLLTEDYYVFNKLAKGLVGTNNVDTNSRLCMSSAVAGYKLSLGADAPPACYEDIDTAACLFISGSNTAFAHPILFRRIEDARTRNPALKIIVVDPRRTDTAACADLHLAIHPGTDVALYNAMLAVMIAEDLIDRDYIAAHTEGYVSLAAIATAAPLAAAARLCGVPAEAIATAARWFARSGATLSLYCQGLNQSSHGTHNNSALINLHLATGQIGRPGAGPFSLTGQPNAMGGREVGGMANLLSAHRDLANAVHRAEVAHLWGVPSVPAKPGKTAVELFQAIADGAIRAVWIACTNPAQSMPDQPLVRRALGRAEFVVVQEAYRDTDTVAYADVLLPATTWGEKDGTVTNSERRISRVRAAVAPPGEARHDWAIAIDFAIRLGAKLGNPHAGALFPYTDAEGIFDEHRESTRGRDLDITGLSFALLDAAGPQQWPLPEGATAGRARLYEDGVFPTATGRARFVDTRYSPVAEPVDAAYPLAFNTGRLRDQWHGMSRTGTVPRLFGHAGAPSLAMHPADMAARGLADGDVVRITSRRGALAVQVEASAELVPGRVFMAMHWGSRYMTGAGANALTTGAIDPLSKQPELKHCAVQVGKLDLPVRVVALAQLETGLAALDRLQPLLAQFAYARLVPFGRDQDFVELAGWHDRPLPSHTLAAIDAVLGLDRGDAVMTYDDPARGVGKRVRFKAGRIVAARLAGETIAAGWIRDAMLRGAADPALRRHALAPVAALPTRAIPRGRIVCNCLDVAEDRIRAEFARGAPLEHVQERLGCGTQCGSCLPELRRLAANTAPVRRTAAAAQ